MLARPQSTAAPSPRPPDGQIDRDEFLGQESAAGVDIALGIDVEEVLAGTLERAEHLQVAAPEDNDAALRVQVVAAVGAGRMQRGSYCGLSSSAYTAVRNRSGSPHLLS